MKAERLNMIRQMLEQNPNDPFLRYAAALEYKKFGQKEECIQYFKALINDHPEYLATYYQYGKLLEEDGNTTEAIAIYRTGKQIALRQNDNKAIGEISEALMLLDEED